MLLFGFQVEDAAKPGGQESVKNQEVSSESFTGDYLLETNTAKNFSLCIEFLPVQCNLSFAFFSLFWSPTWLLISYLSGDDKPGKV